MTKGVDGYQSRAERAPNNEHLAAEIRRLSAQGLKPRDVASVLCIHPLIVVRTLTEGPPSSS